MSEPTLSEQIAAVRTTIEWYEDSIVQDKTQRRLTEVWRAVLVSLEAQQAAPRARGAECKHGWHREGSRKTLFSEANAQRLAEIRSEVAMLPEGHLRARIARDLLAELEEAIERTIDLGAKRVNELVAERDALQLCKTAGDEVICAQARRIDTLEAKLAERDPEKLLAEIERLAVRTHDPVLYISITVDALREALGAK